MRAGVALTALVLLAGCSTNTKSNWSCGAVAGSSCAAISQTDQATVAPQAVSAAVSDARGGSPLRYWAPEPFVFSDQVGARREGDQVMRIVFAPWVDAQGDLHERSVVQAVMRRGGWWMSPPIPQRPPTAALAALPTADPFAPTGAQVPAADDPEN